MTLKDAELYQWYEVIEPNGMVPVRMCIQYYDFNKKTRRYIVIGESICDEIGYYIHEDDADKIKLKALHF